MDASSSQVTPAGVVYYQAHMTTSTGSKLDADQLTAVLGNGNALQQVFATGNVKAFVDDVATKRKYTVTSDNAVFDPKANTIDLTGNVKTVILSPFTDGPLVQTGTTATVQLGKGPTYPQVVMHQVHTEFDLKQ